MTLQSAASGTLLAEHPDVLASATNRGAESSVRRVLVVDDEESIRRALGKFLKTRGFDVVTAGTGDEALAPALRRESGDGGGLSRFR